MIEFLKDIYIVFTKTLKDYYRWKLHFIYDSVFPLMDGVLFILIWGAILGAGGAVGILNQDNYVAFLISGLILWSFASHFLTGKFSNTFVEEKHRRTIQYLLSSRINKMAIPYGISVLPVLRSLYSSAVLILLGLAFGYVFSANLLLVAIIVILMAALFSGIGLILAALGSWRDDIPDLRWILNYVLQIGAGVFFPISILPEGIRSVLLSLPSTQAVQAIRLVVLEDAGFGQLLPLLIPLTLATIVIGVLAVVSFKFVERKAILVGI